MHSTTELISEALHLKPAERFSVIDALINSLDAPDSAVEDSGIAEAEKRLQAYKAGRLGTVSFEDMFGK